jgi:cytoskeletal protein CcmA (bactofilin family)
MFLKYLRRAKGSNQRGSLMIEAIAMLGLIAMVTPMLYKKAAERTTELEDINLANNARLVSRAMNNYIKAHSVEISKGKSVDTDSCGGGSVNYPASYGNETVFDVEHLCEFLPTGYVGKNKTFKEVKVAIKKYTNDAGDDVIGGAFAMKPTSSSGLPKIRTSRIASMIGANGGFTSEDDSDDSAYGVQGAWEIDVGDYFSGSWKPGKGAIVVTAFNTGLNDNKGYLYRNKVDGSPELNKMLTDLDMGTHDVYNVKRMIVDGNQTDAGADDKIYVKSGDIRVAGGDIHVSGDVRANDVNASGLVRGASGNFTNRVDVGASTDITGSEVKSTTLTSTGATDVGGMLTVAGETNLAGNTTIGDDSAVDTLSVRAATTFEGTTQFNNVLTAQEDVVLGSDSDDSLTVKAEAKFEEDATFEKALDVTGNLSAKDIHAKGNLTVDGNTVIGDDGTTDKLTVNAASTFEEQARFNGGIQSKYIEGTTGTLDIRDSNKVRIHKYTDTSIGTDISFADDRTGVYVRKGFIDTTDVSVIDNEKVLKNENFIRTHRLISDTSYNDPANAGGDDPAGYDKYQINPAYTSVMRDIKLATRGGARLSEILPDFITKQIYVLDATYQHCTGSNECPDKGSVSPKWTGVVPPVSYSNGVFSDGSGVNECTGTGLCEVSEWLGFIPSPVCPRNYSAIVTMSPLRWKMSNAHYNSGSQFKPGATPVGFGYHPNQSVGEVDDTLTVPDTVSVLTYQTNTWLALTVESHCTKTSSFGTPGDDDKGDDKVACSDDKVEKFWGWSGVMGFIYPNKMFHPSSPKDDEYVWNPFPVYNTELSATATVYCLFMRKDPKDGSSRWDPSVVDNNYDQLRNFQYSKDGRSNVVVDPGLSYKDDRTVSSEIGNENQ